MLSKLIFSFATLLTFTALAQPENKVVDKIAAQVGDNIILLSDFRKEQEP